MIRIPKISRFCVFSIFILVFMSCNSDKNEIIPLTYVNITIDLQDPEFLDLTSITGRINVTGGYNDNGIVIYRSGLEEFKAYDRTCTYKIENNCRVAFDEGSIVLVDCPCCESAYELNYGSVTKGPSTYPLKEYKTSFSDPYLRIYN